MFDFSSSVLDLGRDESHSRQQPPSFWRSLGRFVVWWVVFVALALALGLASPRA